MNYQNPASITKEDIKKAKTTELVELYNILTKKSIKKFDTRSNAEARVLKLISSIAPAPKKQTNGKRDEYENRKIELLVKENPKREGSRANAKFEILMAMNGKTIKDFKNEEGKHTKLDTEEGWPATELRWATKFDLVKIVK